VTNPIHPPVGSFNTLSLFQDGDDPLVFRTRVGTLTRADLERALYVRVFTATTERKTGFLYQQGHSPDHGMAFHGPAQEITTPRVDVIPARDLRDFLIKMKRM
jgi:hypothetical protein